MSPNKLGNDSFITCIVKTFIAVTAHNTQRVVDVRLTGGSNSYSGILQLQSITPPTDWQDFSCGSRIYDRRVFAVAYRMLGFENIVHYSSKYVPFFQFITIHNNYY